MKKIIALVCALVMMVSVFASMSIVSYAAVDGVTATLDFVGFEKPSDLVTFAVVDLYVTIPEELSAYRAVEPDYINSIEYTYEGVTIQGFGFYIPYVEGLTFVAPKSSTTIPNATVSADANNNRAAVMYAATGSYDTYYAGELNKIATLYYMVSDATATYDLALSSATVGIAAWSGTTANPTTYEYRSSEDAFTITNAVVEPEEEEVEYENVDTKIADLVADTTPLVAEDGTKFTNVAKYAGSFNLKTIKDGLNIAGGEELIKVGFKKNNVADTFTSIDVSGDGTVEYSFLFYGIADASVLDIDTYYTAKKIQAAN